MDLHVDYVCHKGQFCPAKSSRGGGDAATVKKSGDRRRFKRSLTMNFIPVIMSVKVDSNMIRVPPPRPSKGGDGDGTEGPATKFTIGTNASSKQRFPCSTDNFSFRASEIEHRSRSRKGKAGGEGEGDKGEWSPATLRSVYLRRWPPEHRFFW